MDVDKTTTRDDPAARGGSSRDAYRLTGPQDKPGHRLREKHGPGSTRNRPEAWFHPAPDRSPGRSGYTRLRAASPATHKWPDGRRYWHRTYWRAPPWRWR